MRIFKFFFAFFLSFFLLHITMSSSSAADECALDSIIATDTKGKTHSSPFPGGTISRINYSIKVKEVGFYKVYGDGGWVNYFTSPPTLWDYAQEFPTTDTLNGAIVSKFPEWPQFSDGQHSLHVQIWRVDTSFARGHWETYGTGSCDSIGYEVSPALLPSPSQLQACKFNIQGYNNTFNSTDLITIQVFTHSTSINGTLTVTGLNHNELTIPTTHGGSIFTSQSRTFPDDLYTVRFVLQSTQCVRGCPSFSCTDQFRIDDKQGGQPTLTPTPVVPTLPPQCQRGIGGSPPRCAPNNCEGECRVCKDCPDYGKRLINIPDLKPLCDQVADPNSKDGKVRDVNKVCNQCIKGEGDYTAMGPGIWSAIGCIPTDPVGILNKYVLAAAGFGIAGGVAFLYFLYGAFLILTSMGNPERINEGKEIMVSAISGLLLILFSVFIIQVIGVDILRIPGLGPTPTPTP